MSYGTILRSFIAVLVVLGHVGAMKIINLIQIWNMLALCCVSIAEIETFTIIGDHLEGKTDADVNYVAWSE